VQQTNPEESAAREKVLRQRAGLDNTLMARANKERLGVLLAEARDKTGGEERYRAALDGQTKGTSSGSSRGVYQGVRTSS